ncbi:MAG TPA: outer membrane beta-barrel protein [Fulvivirga sp.]|nr:outer membrane beta-barrel protein [Fulvivirga sp.]
MKKNSIKFFKSLAIGLFVLSSTQVWSQEDSGLQVGLMTSINNNQFESAGSVFGFMAGGFADYNYKFLNGRIGIVYDRLGGARPDLEGLEQPLSTTSVTFTDRRVSLHNVSVPLLVSVYYPGSEDADLKPRLTAGIAYSYTIKAIEKRDIMFEFDDNTYARFSGDKEDVSGDYQQHHLTYMAGFGFDFNLSDGRKAYIEVLYKRGINEINKVELARRGNLGDIYTNTISIGFGTTIFKF